MVRRKKLRHFGRCLALETAIRHCLACLNPVSSASRKTQGSWCLQLSVAFEVIWLDTSFRQAQYFNLGHTRARYFPPENGGLIPLGGFANGVFRIDHDQAFQQTSVFRYQRPHNAVWIDFTWRYDSGLVVSGVPDVLAATMLTASQQVDIGFSCNGVPATLQSPITTCNGIGKSTLLTLPQTGAENDDHNPDRVKSRNLFSIGIGTDNLFLKELGPRVKLRFAAENLTNCYVAVQFLIDLQRDPFRCPSNLSGLRGLCVLIHSCLMKSDAPLCYHDILLVR